MNLEKFTERAKGFLQSAQTVATRLNHQRLAPEHLLKALLEDDQGMAAGLIKARGGDAATAVGETDAAPATIPAVSGSGSQTTPERKGRRLKSRHYCAHRTPSSAEKKKPQ